MASGDDRNVYPIALDVHGRRCLVVGGGGVGTLRARKLLDAGAQVRVVSPVLTDQLQSLVDAGVVADHRAHEYRPDDLDGCVLVIAATNDPALNRLIADDAQAAGVFVNVVDAPEHSTFAVPATLTRGALTVAVTTGGASPVLARHVRQELEMVIGSEWGALAHLLGNAREQLKEAFPDPAERAAAVEQLLRSPIADLLASGAHDRAAELVRDSLDGTPPAGHVALVGAGPGDPELLTVRAATLIRRAEAIVHDRLGTESVLPLAAGNCELIDVGKAPGHHGRPQEEINALLVQLAQAGRRVVRLKGGDPFVFGRGGEEALALAAAGVAFEIVPGVSSAIGGAAAAGVPVTHRGLAQSVTFASGHDDPDSPAAQARWRALGAAPGTLVLMMAMTNLAAIAAALIAGGRAADEPTVAVHWATTAQQREVHAPLDEIAVRCAEAGVGNPSVVVIGPVVEVGRQIAAAMGHEARRSP